LQHFRNVADFHVTSSWATSDKFLWSCHFEDAGEGTWTRLYFTFSSHNFFGPLLGGCSGFPLCDISRKAQQSAEARKLSSHALDSQLRQTSSENHAKAGTFWAHTSMVSKATVYQEEAHAVAKKTKKED